MNKEKKNNFLAALISVSYTMKMCSAADMENTGRNIAFLTGDVCHIKNMQ